MQAEMNRTQLNNSSLSEYEEIAARLDRLDEKVEFVRAEVAQRTGRKVGRGVGVLYGVLVGFFVYLFSIILFLIVQSL